MTTLAPKPPSLRVNPKLSQWLQFHRDGRVFLLTGKVEIGQGIGTALRQIAAEELDVALEDICLIAGRTNQTPDELWTSASISIETGGAAVRHAAAHARHLFGIAAARRLNTSVENVVVTGGVFSAGGESVTYRDLVDRVDLNTDVDFTLPTKAPTTYRLVGQNSHRSDLPAKLSGEAGAFIHDVVLEGMLHARVVHPVRPTDKILSVDIDALKFLPGVAHVVRDGSFLALVAEREEDAIAAAEQAFKQVTWRPGDPLPDSANVEQFLDGYEAEARAVSAIGRPEIFEPTCSLTITKPFLAHASIGLCTALARPETDGRLTVWSHSQGVFPLREALAAALRLEPAQITVIHKDGSGCYGHNGADDVALDAALVALAVGRSVRLSWTRSQEFCSAPLGPPMKVEVAAKLENGRITQWTHKVKSLTHLNRPGWGDGVNLLSAWRVERPCEPSEIDDPGQIPHGGAGDRNAPPLYDFPNQDVSYDFIRRSPVRTSALRSLGAFANVFAIESLMDELAAIADRDPVQFRLAHLGDPRARRVVEEAAEMAGWRQRSTGDGETGWGFGVARYKNSGAWCAVALKLGLDERITVTEVHGAVDCGFAINPDGVINQIEGGIIQAISWALIEEVVLRPDGIEIAGWDDYPILSFAQVPMVRVKLVGEKENRSLGAGECTMGPVAGAIGNAIKDALGVRVTDLPLRPERVASALA